MTKDESQGEDVTQETEAVETDTTDTSSSVDETDQKTGESSSAEDTKGTDSQHVPYDRFREANEKAKEWEAKYRELEGKAKVPEEVNPQKEQVKEALKPILEELGYVSKEELERIEEDKQVQSELSQLEAKYDGSDGRPKFKRDDVVRYAIENKIGSVEAAYKMLHEKELINWSIKQAQTKSKGIKTETSDGSGSAEAGTTNDDLKAAIAKGDKTALRTFLKRITPKS